MLVVFVKVAVRFAMAPSLRKQLFLILFLVEEFSEKALVNRDKFLFVQDITIHIH